MSAWGCPWGCRILHIYHPPLRDSTPPLPQNPPLVSTEANQAKDNIAHPNLSSFFDFSNILVIFAIFELLGVEAPLKNGRVLTGFSVGSIWGSQPIPPTPQRLLTFGTPYFYDQGSDLIISEEWQNTTFFTSRFGNFWHFFNADRWLKGPMNRWTNGWTDGRKDRR